MSNIKKGKIMLTGFGNYSAEQNKEVKVTLHQTDAGMQAIIFGGAAKKAEIEGTIKGKYSESQVLGGMGGENLLVVIKAGYDARAALAEIGPILKGIVNFEDNTPTTSPRSSPRPWERS